MTIMNTIATQTRRTDACRCRTEISVKSICLVVGLILTTPADSAPLWEPTQGQMAALHGEVDELSDRLKRIESAASTEEQQRLVSAHWFAMLQHLRSVQLNGCHDCGPPRAPQTAECIDMSKWQVPDVPLTSYQATMGKRSGAMHDRMARLKREKSPFERQRLLQQYWRRIYTDMDELRTSQAPVDAAAASPGNSFATRTRSHHEP